jgi:hypothetical protein
MTSRADRERAARVFFPADAEDGWMPASLSRWVEDEHSPLLSIDKGMGLPEIAEALAAVRAEAIKECFASAQRVADAHQAAAQAQTDPKRAVRESEAANGAVEVMWAIRALSDDSLRARLAAAPKAGE